MQKVMKQAVGIDCGKVELVVAFGHLDSNFQISIKATAAFSNDPAGFDKLTRWTEKQSSSQIPLQFIVEATGVYHERLCHYVTTHGYNISVVLPNRAASFMRTMTIKTINDKVSAAALATMGLEKNLENWQIPDPVLSLLKQLCRERNRLMADIVSIKNQIHALTSGAFSANTTLERLQTRLQLCEEQLKDIEQEMKTVAYSKDDLKQRFENVCTIKGVGIVTAISVVAESNGFNLIRNQRQLVSYAGLDVINKQSGISINSPGRISHRGNSQLRKALYFPALVAIRNDEQMQQLYTRLLGRHNIKMKAIVAVQRKLLVMIYTLWKKNEAYNPKYLEQSQKTALTELVHDRS